MLSKTSSIVINPSGQAIGAILPYSEKVLDLNLSHEEVNRKIQKTKNRIQHLQNQLAQRQTHGGKAFRAKKVSLNDEVSRAVMRLHLLVETESEIRTAILNPSIPRTYNFTI